MKMAINLGIAKNALQKLEARGIDYVKWYGCMTIFLSEVCDVKWYGCMTIFLLEVCDVTITKAME